MQEPPSYPSKESQLIASSASGDVGPAKLAGDRAGASVAATKLSARPRRETFRKGTRVASEGPILFASSSEIELLASYSSTFGASVRHLSRLFGRSQKCVLRGSCVGSSRK